jgi:hypothetical protein
MKTVQVVTQNDRVVVMHLFLLFSLQSSLPYWYKYRPIKANSSLVDPKWFFGFFVNRPFSVEKFCYKK